MEKVKTEVYEIFAPDPKYKVLVIPGNPGSSNLYLPLLMDLDEVFNNTCDIMLISHRGHTIEKYEEDELFTYEDQIEHVANIIKTNIDENPVVPIILVGHRLGCNILFEALKYLDFYSNIKKIIALYPETARNPYPIVSLKYAFAYMFSGLPDACKKLVLPETHVAVCKYHILKQSIYMAETSYISGLLPRSYNINIVMKSGEKLDIINNGFTTITRTPDEPSFNSIKMQTLLNKMM